MAESATVVFPTELRVKERGRCLGVAFSDGRQFEISSELLRVESPSAEVKGHGPGEEHLVWGKRGVMIIKLEPVGNYAVRIIFSDGHASGIFTWGYLAKLGSEGLSIFEAYAGKLKAAGLSR
jgi:DUF971 family protein